ncbi:MAG: site-2 protease family protein [Candidatus Yanofskybacteria bacterium]|nr:site-2 protease family protein [Candidatus Yanofskybacteria bacterium]
MEQQAFLLIFQVIVLIYSVVIHEVAHGVMAYSMGDTTAKHLGRLTLNPIKHLDMFGSFLLPLLLVIIRSPFLFGYAKPVPYNPRNLNDRVYGAAKVGAAGPLANITLAVLFGLILRFLPLSVSNTILPQLLSFVVLVNLMLAVFNLFPIPPLDGHWLLLALLPARYSSLVAFLYRNSILLMVVFIVFIFPRVYPIVGFIFRLITGVSI